MMSSASEIGARDINPKSQLTGRSWRKVMFSSTLRAMAKAS